MLLEIGSSRLKPGSSRYDAEFAVEVRLRIAIWSSLLVERGKEEWRRKEERKNGGGLEEEGERRN